MLIRTHTSTDLRASDITPRAVYEDRRQLLRALA